MLLVKIDATTGAKVWSTVWGTAGDDRANGVAVDSDGAAHVDGNTAGALDGNTNAGGADAVVFKFDSAGVRQ